ncbi:MAG: hypothetical protein ACI9XO_000831 [Paraglaciecola sp.]
MKNFIRIFTIYFLVLTFLPVGSAGSSCCDQDSGEDTEIIVADTEQDASNHCGEGCGSTCLCSCCGHIFIPTFALDLVEKEFPPLAKTTPQLMSQMHGIIFPTGIWQPPQFA